MARLEPPLADRIAALGPLHRPEVSAFVDRVEAARAAGRLNAEQAAIVAEHAVRLGERQRDPANTGNIEDLFFHTLEDTGDPTQAFAQALADSIKTVPLASTTPLYPALIRTRDGRRVTEAGGLEDLGPMDTMLVSHTMAAYGDPEMWTAAERFVAATHPDLDRVAQQHEAHRMAAQSQHLPSCTFVMARAHGYTLDVEPLYERAGFAAERGRAARAFYDHCAAFAPEWANTFALGTSPTTPDWRSWAERFRDLQTALPNALRYQLYSDTMTNFLEGTMRSGKWTDTVVRAGLVRSRDDLISGVCAIANQYLAEYDALHGRPIRELIERWQSALKPWGIRFADDRAEPAPGRCEREDAWDQQWARAQDRADVPPADAPPPRPRS